MPADSVQMDFLHGGQHSVLFSPLQGQPPALWTMCHVLCIKRALTQHLSSLESCMNFESFQEGSSSFLSNFCSDTGSLNPAHAGVSGLKY